MDILYSIILGIVQGLTEFLPISSSGHLIIFRDLLGVQMEYGLAFDAVLQLATTLAVLVYFKKDIVRFVKSFFDWVLQKDVSLENKNLVKAIIWGTIPAIILGIILEEKMETVFRDSTLVAITLIIGALIMFFADYKFRKETNMINAKNGFFIGLFQALALVPGMSRSGMTISGGLLLGLHREEAIRFSFLLAFPILLGSGLKKLYDLFQIGFLETSGMSLLFGSLASFAVGLLAIHFLITFLKKNTMKGFVIYRIILATLILIIGLF